MLTRILVAALALSLATPSLAGPPKKPAPKAPASARHTYKLTHEPITPNPGPSVLIHLMKGFKKSGPLNLVVYFHGIMNCIESTVEAKAGACKGGGGTAHGIINHADASSANAVLIALEMAHKKNNTDTGHLAEDGYFGQIIDEVLPKIGALAGRNYSRDDLGKVVLASHSGGYAAVGDVLAHGGMEIAGVLLFDSLYSNPKKTGPKERACYDKYLTWAKSHTDGKLAIVYTKNGGTLANSQALAADVTAAVGAGSVFDKRTLPDAKAMKSAGLNKPFVFVKSGFVHDDSVRFWLQSFLQHAGL